MRKGVFWARWFWRLGGIAAEDILDYAAAKVDIISMGQLTHSVKALDISLELVVKEATF